MFELSDDEVRQLVSWGEYVEAKFPTPVPNTTHALLERLRNEMTERDGDEIEAGANDVFAGDP